MKATGLFDPFPLWIVFVGSVLITFLSVEVGRRLGLYRRERSQDEKEAPIGGMVGATLGLLAFMLAFTFSMASSRFEDRRQVVLSEANAIGTAYLRAAMLPEPMSTEERRLLRQYVDVRLGAAEPGKAERAIEESEALHQQLWAQAVAAAQKERTPMVSLFIQSLNEVIDLHAKRVMVALRSRVPAAIWIGLYALLVIAMAAMGYHAGLTSQKRSLAAFALVFAFSSVLFLIADLDRPGQGLLQVSQESMLDVKNSMK
jgi:hypothetical protein